MLLVVLLVVVVVMVVVILMMVMAVTAVHQYPAMREHEWSLATRVTYISPFLSSLMMILWQP